VNRKLLITQRKLTQAGKLEKTLVDIVHHLDVATWVMKHYDILGPLLLLLLYVQLHSAYLARTRLKSNSAKCYHSQFYHSVLHGTFGIPNSGCTATFATTPLHVSFAG
jgi:hypothetical protein